MQYLDRKAEKFDTAYELSTNIRVMLCEKYMWYHDGEHTLYIAGIIFPDGTEWNLDAPNR